MSGITWRIEHTSPIMGFFTYHGVQPSSPIMASTCFTSEAFSLLGVTLVCHGILELPALVWQRSNVRSGIRAYRRRKKQISCVRSGVRNVQSGVRAYWRRKKQRSNVRSGVRAYRNIFIYARSRILPGLILIYIIHRIGFLN